MSASPNGRAALVTGSFAAILASTCCLGPLVLVALGFSGAWIGNLTALEPYRPIFIGAALVALFFAGRRVSQARSARSHRCVEPTRFSSGSWRRWYWSRSPFPMSYPSSTDPEFP